MPIGAKIAGSMIQDFLEDLTPKATRAALKGKEKARLKESLRRAMEVGEAPLVPKKHGKAPDATGEWPFAKKILQEAAPGKRDQYTSMISRWEKALGEGRRKAEAFRGLLEKGVEEETRLVPIDVKVGATWDDAVRKNVTLSEAADMYEADPSRIKFASTPTGGPPVKHLRFGGEAEVPGIGRIPQMEQYQVKSIVPELRVEEAKIRGEPTPAKKTVVRKKERELATKEGQAWYNIIADAPKEAGFWRQMMMSQPSRGGGVRKESAKNFFMRMYKEYRSDPFKFAKKRRGEGMINKFETYKKKGWMTGIGAVSIFDYIEGEE